MVGLLLCCWLFCYYCARAHTVDQRMWPLPTRHLHPIPMFWTNSKWKFHDWTYIDVDWQSVVLWPHCLCLHDNQRYCELVQWQQQQKQRQQKHGPATTVPQFSTAASPTATGAIHSCRTTAPSDCQCTSTTECSVHASGCTDPHSTTDCVGRSISLALVVLPFIPAQQPIHQNPSGNLNNIKPNNKNNEGRYRNKFRTNTQIHTMVKNTYTYNLQYFT